MFLHHAPKSLTLSLSLATLMVLSPSASFAQTIDASGPYVGPGGFDRGYQSTMHCGNNPESWVRGSASLDSASGTLVIQAQLETDSTTAGPKGTDTVLLRDAAGQILAQATTDEIGIGGKPPGKSVIRNFSKSIQIPLNVAVRTTSLSVQAQCTGSISQLWGIDSGDVIHAIDFVVTAVGAAGG